MKPFQKIMVATDFSAPAEAATRIAADLSRRYAAPLTLVHVYQPITHTLPAGVIMFTPTPLNDLLAKLERRLEEYRREALAHGARDGGVRLLMGFTPREIVSMATDLEFDLIVMGTRGHRGLQRLLTGSVAERVVRTAPCPVLTMRMPESGR
jgi:universal stress protein A